MNTKLPIKGIWNCIFSILLFKTKKSYFLLLGVSLWIYVLAPDIALAQEQPHHKFTIHDEKCIHHIEQGNRLYEEDEYYLAFTEYEKALSFQNHNTHALYQAAQCLRHIFDYEKAAVYYRKVSETDKIHYPYSELYYGLTLKMSGQYQEALKEINLFIENFKPTSGQDSVVYDEAWLEKQGCELAIKNQEKAELARKLNFIRLPAPVSSSYTDFAPIIYDNDSSIVVTSSRKESKGKRMNKAIGEMSFDNFRFRKAGEEWIPMDNKDKFSKINSRFDDGAGEFTKDKSKYYFTVCKPECSIYVSVKSRGKFRKPKKLNSNINAKGYWNAQPTLSPTGDTMIFVSKRKGGKGEDDLWMSISKNKNKEEWGKAINLSDLNTPYNEISPYWDDATNAIYFASDGHPGYGGLDIYKAENKSEVVNLGHPFNSYADDMYFNHGKKKGYLASNRKGGLGHMDIFSFDYDIDIIEQNIKAADEPAFETAEDEIEKEPLSINIIIGDSIITENYPQYTPVTYKNIDNKTQKSPVPLAKASKTKSESIALAAQSKPTLVYKNIPARKISKLSPFSLYQKGLTHVYFDNIFIVAIISFLFHYSMVSIKKRRK